MDITLSPGALLQWRCPEAIELQVCTGRLWLTVAGDPRDRFLDAGERWHLPPDRVAVLGAEGPVPLQLQGRRLPRPSGTAGPDMPAWRRRARHQRAVAQRWWWRRCRRSIGRAWARVVALARFSARPRG